MAMKVITAPTVEPITLSEARLHLRVTPDDESPPQHPDDALIESLITAAREWCEQYTMRALASQTVEIALDSFPDQIQLPFSPVTSITSVKYIDGDEVEQTLSAALYTLDDYQQPSWLLPAINTEWPTVATVINAVKVRYVCGYTSATLPAPIRAAMLLLIGNWYENREAIIIGTIQSNLSFAVEALLLPYRLRLSMK